MSLEPPRRACEMMLWFILFFAPAAFGATEWWSRAVLESLIFILAAMCALRRDFSAPAGGPLWGFVWILVLGAFQLLQVRPLADPVGLLPFTLSRPQTLYALLMWAALAALLWAASGILRWEGALHRLSWAILLIGLFIAVVGILQRGQGNTAYYGIRPIRHGLPFGPFTNYNHAATWMVASACVGTGLFVKGFERGRAHLTERVARQVLVAFALLILIAGVLETKSRGGINALFTSAIVTAFLAAVAMPRARDRHITCAALILTGGAYAVFLYNNPRWSGFVDGALEASAAYRVSMYRSGLRMLADFPIFGIGLGNFANAFHPYQESFVVGLVDHVHSSWLEIALETGLLGIAAFGAFVLAPLAALGRRLTSIDFNSRAVAAGCFAALLAVTLHGFVEFSFQIPADAVIFVVLASTMPVLMPSAIKSAPAAVRPPRVILAGAFMVLVFLSLPPGFAGGSLRLAAPFQSATDTLLPVSAPQTSDLVHERRMAWEKRSD